MKLLIYLSLFAIFLELLISYTQASDGLYVNLTEWKAHRRQKRFLIYQNGGVIKLVTGVTLPTVQFPDKRFWRQLVWLMNLQYQFPEPTTPIYWWNKFRSRNLVQAVELPSNFEIDEPQKFLYEFAVRYLNQSGMNGVSCLSRLICENAQIHEHSGLFAELLYRVLIPHKSLDARYTDAYKMGKHGVNCRHAYLEAAEQDCFLDRFLHVRDTHMGQSFVKTGYHEGLH